MTDLLQEAMERTATRQKAVDRFRAFAETARELARLGVEDERRDVEFWLAAGETWLTGIPARRLVAAGAHGPRLASVVKLVVGRGGIACPRTAAEEYAAATVIDDEPLPPEPPTPRAA